MREGACSITNKRLTSRTQIEFLQVIKKKKREPNRKWAKTYMHQYT